MNYFRALAIKVLNSTSIRQCIYREKHDDRSILIAALPKSGSTYLYKTLNEGFGYTKNVPRDVETTGFPYGQLTGNVVRLKTMNCITRTHIAGTDRNLFFVDKYGVRIVLHVCDPRQAVVSWVFYLDRQLKEHGKVHLFDSFCVRRPDCYLSEYTFEQKMDFWLDHFYRPAIQWLQRWREQTKKRSDLLVTTKRDLSEPEKLCERILEFYNIPTRQFTYTEMKKDDRVKFRKGDPNEWRTVCSPDQIEKMNGMVSDDLLEFCGSER